MGYYSNVAIKLQKNAYRELRYAVSKDGLYPSAEAVCADGIAIIFEDVKWREEFDEIAHFRKMLNTFDELGESLDGYGYYFIRIGENYDDVEVCTNNIDMMIGLKRSFDFNM